MSNEKLPQPDRVACMHFCPGRIAELAGVFVDNTTSNEQADGMLAGQTGVTAGNGCQVRCSKPGYEEGLKIAVEKHIDNGYTPVTTVDTEGRGVSVIGLNPDGQLTTINSEQL